jgi:hypothetical protein
MTMSPRLLLCLAFAVLPAAAQADARKAAACAGGLPPEARAIYDATAAEAAKGGDLRALLSAKVRPMVMAGQVSRGTARASAEAAGQCLVAARE